MSPLNSPQRHTLDVVNIMEVLVLEEVDDQLSHRIGTQLVRYINRVEVATYALNRLPALYASSQEGVYYQVKRAKMQYGEQIGEAVSKGIAAVLRDPLRTSTPLTPEALSRVNIKLNLPPEGDRETPVREIYHQTFADRRSKKAGTSAFTPRKLAHQNTREMPSQPERKVHKTKLQERVVKTPQEYCHSPEPDEYKPDPRDLAYQAAQELRMALQAKDKTEYNPAFV